MAIEYWGDNNYFSLICCRNVLYMLNSYQTATDLKIKVCHFKIMKYKSGWGWIHSCNRSFMLDLLWKSMSCLTIAL